MSASRRIAAQIVGREHELELVLAAVSTGRDIVLEDRRAPATRRRPRPAHRRARAAGARLLLDVTGEHDRDVGRELSRAGRGRLFRRREHRDVAPALNAALADPLP